MSCKKFKDVAANPEDPKWTKLIERVDPIYNRDDDPRSHFSRDYNRILHCTAYRRLKHKTQVFFATGNDHICTRIEHVNHVMAISHTISEELGLNTGLTDAIAIGHDLGHAPFGHEGERILNSISERELNDQFWHEKNSLWFVDNLETLASPQNLQSNLALTYAVRDGIICHCGEVDQNMIKPRNEAMDLSAINKRAEHQPYTWEGCIVKIADKIAFLGRDIEDAFTLKFIQPREFVSRSTGIAPELPGLLEKTSRTDLENISNTAIIHGLIMDLITSSDPQAGLQFSRVYLELMDALRKVTAILIYDHPRLKHFKRLADLVLNSLFSELSSLYQSPGIRENIEGKSYLSPRLYRSFEEWIIKYSDLDEAEKESRKFSNKVVYHLQNKVEYIRAVIDFISGMTDNFALETFEELTKFR